MKGILTLGLFIFYSCTLSAQIPDGSIAPDWSLEDILGTNHTLYEHLDAGKSVIIEFSATWCPICWNYQNSGTLGDLYADLGPDGTDEIMVFKIEFDSGTSQDCIYGASSCTGGTIGDWTQGIDYPIINPPASEADDIASDYNILFSPTIFGIAPNGEVLLVGQASYDEWESILINSFALQNSTFEINGGGCSNDINLMPIGGEGNLTFEWSNGSTTEDLFDVEIGTYSVSITDENDYEVVVGPIDILTNNNNEIVDFSIENVLCNGQADGSILVEAEGGSGEFSFDWSNGASGNEIFDLSGGEYSLTVTDNVFGCTSEAAYMVEEPTLLESSFVVSDAGCNEDGNVSFTVSGGTGPYTFIFEDFSTSESNIDLAAGNYNVTISDENDCTNFSSFEILSPELPNAIASSNGIIDCINTSSELSSSGSDTGANISYTWLDEDGNIDGVGTNHMVTIGGIYTLVVTDTDCSASTEVEVITNIEAPLAVSNASNVIDCNNTTSMVSGDGSTTSNVSYEWSTTDGSIISGSNQLNATVDTAGTYTLVVTNLSNGCTASSTTIVTENTNTPSASITPATNICEGESFQICVTTDATNNIEWIVDGSMISSSDACIEISSSSSILATVVNPANGCSSTVTTSTNIVASPSPSISGNTEFCAGSSTTICANAEANEIIQWTNEAGQNFGNSDCITINTPGIYQVNVSNTENCQTTVETIITQNELPSAAITGDLVLCEGSTSTLCANETGLSYQWTANGITLGTEECLTIDMAGNYQLNVSNDICTNTSSSMVAVEAIPNLLLETSGILDCSNQSVVISAMTNGTEITWTDALGNILSTGPSYTSVLAGEYFASSVSALGCENIQSIIVEQDNAALPIAEYSFSSTELVLNFENLSQGMPTSYLWDFGDGNTSSEENPTHSYAEAGLYTVCMTATNDCGINSICQEIQVVTELVVDLTSLAVSCFGGNDGEINLTISGGIEPYSISSNPDIGNATSFVGLMAGQYDFVILDNNGSQVNISTTIDQPTEIEVVGSIANASAANNDGAIMIEVTGGIPGYTYAWNNGSTASFIENLSVGLYYVTITDANGCYIIEEYEVKELTSTYEIDFIQEFIVSPNPAFDELNIQLSASQKAEIKIELRNHLGQIIYESKINSEEPIFNIDVSEFVKGVYFIQLRHQNQSLSQKIIIVD